MQCLYFFFVVGYYYCMYDCFVFDMNFGVIELVIDVMC